MTLTLTRTHWFSIAAVVLALLFAGAATVASAGGDGHSAGQGGGAGTPAVPAGDSADAGFARDMAVHHQQAVEMSFIVRDRTGDEEVRRLAYDIANTQANQRGMMLGWLDLWGLPKVDPGSEPMAWMERAHGKGGHTAGDGGDGGRSGGSGHGGTGHSEGSPGSGEGSHAPGNGDEDATAGSDGQRPGTGALMPGMATQAELDLLAEADGEAAEVLFLQLMTDHHKGGVDMAEGCAELCTVPQEKALAQGMVDAQQSEIDLMADLLRNRGAAPRSWPPA
ncbi:DUF305 domain-containing protein [Streptomyces pacificus]|uniref:DUF305 domain-containing protein n=1 Tax=Streptomyces pacificus TaxID=2705029 RepID=A0A6A0ARI1_9ACTN|nr:DUF305 domain-containing protein [Streptomyces pacificus]GFH34961.1 DUF305 domain-containing protein [Streptomyces pacificus]